MFPDYDHLKYTPTALLTDPMGFVIPQLPFHPKVEEGVVPLNKSHQEAPKPLTGVPWGSNHGSDEARRRLPLMYDVRVPFFRTASSHLTKTLLTYPIRRANPGQHLLKNSNMVRFHLMWAQNNCLHTKLPSKVWFRSHCGNNRGNGIVQTPERQTSYLLARKTLPISLGLALLSAPHPRLSEAVSLQLRGGEPPVWSKLHHTGFGLPTLSTPPCCPPPPRTFWNVCYDTGSSKSNSKEPKRHGVRC